MKKKNWAPAFAGATVVAFLLVATLSATFAQEKAPVKKSEKTEKMEKKKTPVAHKKATPEQIRKFNALEKKQQK